MVSKWVISPTYKWGIPWGYNPRILTIYYLPGTSKYVRRVGEKTHQPDTFVMFLSERASEPTVCLFIQPRSRVVLIGV